MTRGPKAPPATAGRMDSSSVAPTGVSTPDRYRTSSSLRYTLTNLCSDPASSITWPDMPGYCGHQRGQDLAHRGAVDGYGALAPGMGPQHGREVHLDGHVGSFGFRGP